MQPKQNKPPGPHKRTRGENPRASRAAGHVEDAALSTGRAARYCLVSPGSVVNWIAAGQLPAQRTAGRQFRIRVRDLRSFMSAHGMRTDALDADYPICSPCWIFWADRAHETTRSSEPGACADCPVLRARAAVCSEIRPLLAAAPIHARVCSECEYARWRAELEAAHERRMA